MTTTITDHSLGKRKILVAEDVELNQYLARHMIESWGFEVDIAVNGKEALVLVQQNSYDLVLMDIQMPEMDGVEATKQIRQLEDTIKAGIPIVALTANALKGDRERFLAAGMNDYLPKPFNEPNLFRIIADNITKVTIIETDVILEVLTPEIDITAKLYNLSMVYGIAGGDEGFVKRMIRLFLDTVPQSLRDMERETEQENWEQVGKLAHKMKSTIDSMGIVSLKEPIREIESNGRKREHTVQMRMQVALVGAVMKACIEQLEEDFPF
jgi:CheY-like chemotaxis protein